MHWFECLKKWKTSLDKGENVGAILMDLSKAFDCIKHDLLIANQMLTDSAMKHCVLLTATWKTGIRELKLMDHSVPTNNCSLVFRKDKFLVPSSLTST